MRALLRIKTANVCMRFPYSTVKPLQMTVSVFEISEDAAFIYGHPSSLT